MYRSPKLILAVALAIGVLFAYRALMAAGRSEEKGHSISPRNLEVQTVTQSEGPVRETFSGVVRARLNSALSAKVAGRVQFVSVREGDSVRRGQVLVRIDPREEEDSRLAARAGLSAAIADVSSSKLTASMEAQAVRARLDAASAQLDVSRAASSDAKAKLDLVLAGPRTEEREQANQRVVGAGSQLSLAQADLARAQQLYREGAISRQQYDRALTARDSAQADYTSAVQAQSMAQTGSRPEEIRSAREAYARARAQVRLSEAGLSEARAMATQAAIQREAVVRANSQRGLATAALRAAQTSISETVISAPFDGVVTARFVDPGVVAALGTGLVTVASHDLLLEVSIPESKVGLVQMGATAEAQIGQEAIEGTLPGSPSQGRMSTLPARVVELVPQGDIVSHTFTAKLLLPASTAVKPGMYGSATFGLGRQSRLLIPNSALVWRDGLPYAFSVGPDQNAVLRVLTIGERLADSSEILSGLGVGERFVVAPPADLADGAPIIAKGAGK